MDRMLEFVVTIFVSVLGSSGVWAIIQKRMDRKDQKTKLLLGLAQTSIVNQCRFYTSRGDWITEDEYEDLHEYLYKPYSDLGGDGLAKKWIERIEQLRIVPSDYKPPVPNPYFENM